MENQFSFMVTEISRAADCGGPVDRMTCEPVIPFSADAPVKLEHIYFEARPGRWKVGDVIGVTL